MWKCNNRLAKRNTHMLNDYTSCVDDNAVKRHIRQQGEIIHRQFSPTIHQPYQICICTFYHTTQNCVIISYQYIHTTDLYSRALYLSVWRLTKNGCMHFPNAVNVTKSYLSNDWYMSPFLVSGKIALLFTCCTHMYLKLSNVFNCEQWNQKQRRFRY